MYPDLIKENWKISTCNWLDLQTLGISTGYVQKSLRSLIFRHATSVLCKCNALKCIEIDLRAGHYGGQVHRLVKSFSPWHGLFEAREGYAGEDEKIIQIFYSIGVLWRCQVSCMKLWGCPRNLTSGESPLLESVSHVGIHAIFSTMYNVLHRRTLGCSVNHHRTRVSLSANQTFKFF